MKKVFSYFAAVALVPAVFSAGLADLDNPDDVMLRKPAAPVAKPAAKPVVAPKPAAEQPAAEPVAKPAPKPVAKPEVAPKPAAEQPAAEPEAKPAPKPVAKPVAKPAPKPAAELDPDERPAPKKIAPKQVEEDVTAPKKKPAAAKPAKKELTGRPAKITAERTDYDRKEGVILFDRKVYVDDEQYQMHADRLFVFLDGTNELKRLVAIGNVAITNDAKAAGCTKAVFTKDKSRIVMYGSEQNLAWLRDAGGRSGDASEVRGTRITYWIDSGLATVEGVEVTVPGLKGGKDPKDLFGGKKGKKDEKDSKDK